MAERDLELFEWNLWSISIRGINNMLQLVIRQFIPVVIVQHAVKRIHSKGVIIIFRGQVRAFITFRLHRGLLLLDALIIVSVTRS